MYKNHGLMPTIMQQAHVKNLHSIEIIKGRAQQQRNNGHVLQHGACFLRNIESHSVTHYAETARNPLLYENASVSSEEDIATDLSTGAPRSAAEPIERDSSDTGVLVIDTSHMDYDETDVLDTTTRSVSAQSTQRTKCTLVEDYLSPKTGAQETVFTLCIRNLDIGSDRFDYDTLDAMQQFINESREKLKKHERIIAEAAPIIRAQHLTHVNLSVPKNTKTTLYAQIQHNGKLKYINVQQHDNIYDEDQTVLCKQNHILDTWVGNIQHINYQYLYDSLDALFAIVYTHSDIQQTLSSTELAHSMLNTIFYSMHFPINVHNEAIKHYTHRDYTTGRLESPNMPIAAPVCSTGDMNTTMITELAHMSVLMDIHRYTVEIDETFAYQLATALLDDIVKLWLIRQTIMPQQHMYDLFAYGIVPAAQDMLPSDYEQHLDVLRAPAHMLVRTRSPQTTTEYMRNALTLGTTEMCTWACAVSCLKAAAYMSIVPSAKRYRLLSNINDIVRNIDTRFNHFTTINKRNICAHTMRLNIKDVSGGAMPLFCMVICNILSLSQALNNITTMPSYILNTNNLIVIHENIVQTLNM